MEVDQHYSSIGFTKVMRKFRIDPSLVQEPELFVTADFDHENYFPGQDFQCKLKVSKPDGSLIPYGSKISYQLGQGEEHSSDLVLDSMGEFVIYDRVPDDV